MVESGPKVVANAVPLAAEVTAEPEADAVAEAEADFVAEPAVAEAEAVGREKVMVWPSTVKVVAVGHAVG